MFLPVSVVRPRKDIAANDGYKNGSDSQLANYHLNPFNVSFKEGFSLNDLNVYERVKSASKERG